MIQKKKKKVKDNSIMVFKYINIINFSFVEGILYIYRNYY